MTSEPSFTIPVRPERRFPSRGGVEYDGDTTFSLTPEGERDGATLEELVERVLDDGPYRYRSGGFHELPMALWLVRDDGTADVFRVSVRDGGVRLHVLPSTEPDGLRRFYDRLVDHADCEWRVDCRTDVA